MQIQMMTAKKLQCVWQTALVQPSKPLDPKLWQARSWWAHIGHGVGFHTGLRETDSNIIQLIVGWYSQCHPIRLIAATNQLWHVKLGYDLRVSTATMQQVHLSEVVHCWQHFAASTFSQVSGCCREKDTFTEYSQSIQIYIPRRKCCQGNLRSNPSLADVHPDKWIKQVLVILLVRRPQISSGSIITFFLRHAPA